MIATVLFFFFAGFLSGCAILPERKFEATYASSRRALLRGELKEVLAFYESQAQEAEKNAVASSSPQKHWAAATMAYAEASRVATWSGQLQKTVTYGEKSLEIASKTKSAALQIYALHLLIDAYRSVRNFEKVRDLLEKGFLIVKEIPPDTSTRIAHEGNLYLRLGWDLMRRREYEKAIDAFSQSVYLYESYLVRLYGSRTQNQTLIENARTSFILRLTALANAYRQAGNLQQALEHYHRAMNSIKDWELKYAYEPSLYRNLGEIYYQQKNFPQALENFRKALAVAENQQERGEISWTNTRIGDVLRQTGEPVKAIPYYQKAIQQIESTRSLLESEDYRQSYFEGGLSAYVSMIQVLLAAGKQEEAFNYNERARSRVFLDVLGSKVQLSRIRSGLLEEERVLQEHIAAIRARLVTEREAAARAELGRELRGAERAYNAFLAKVRKEDKEQASLMTVEPLTLKEVQELLDPGTTLVEYFVAGSGAFVWVVEKDRMQFVRVKLSRGKLAGLVKSLREAIFSLGERDKFKVASTVLYQHLIEGVLPHVTGKELIIVPHDVLHYLPFHALLAPDGHYLIEKYPIYYLSSASLLQFVKEKRKAKGDLSAVLAQAGRVLAFGNPDLGDPQKDLQFAELEAGEVRRLYPKSSVYVRKEATEERAKGLSSQYDILHFATHAELKDGDPLSSAILLAKDGTEDGRLEVREIFGMDLYANLVVLSACETGLGKLSSGDELVGLTRAFIYAGTPSVVASLWKVEDSSTAALMASFYRNLRTMTKVEALRQAQLELIRGQASSDLLARRGVGGIGKLGEIPQAKPTSPTSSVVSTSHPYFWAPFILVGDGK
ncbi:MAG: hypothetical protein A3H45_06020 [Ignavibacteria bacterium RIFCSPLOWO2_02_FULL_55_14]|nr:MAG: hypothetical protein A3H45_06020 [Ignavibacteria bacterium RIFCSPLOWO2_02_FULL_55_14]